MRVAYNDSDDRAGLRGYVQFHKYTYVQFNKYTYIKSARNLKIAVDAVRETGETWVESGKNVEKKGLVQ